MKVVLDASAVLAFLHQEPGWEAVQPTIEDGCISAVNWCEVAQKIAEKGLDVSHVRRLLADLGLAIEPFSPEQAESAASLWAHTRNLGLSLADRACLALAMDKGLPAMTADRAWVTAELDVEIEVIR